MIPPVRLPLPSLRSGEVIELQAGLVIWRVYFTGGPWPAAWNQFRHWGPGSARFDHHLEPARVQERGIQYGADNPRTALAEVYQRTRIINLHRHQPALAGFELNRAVRVLDLTSLWPTRAGASGELATGAHRRARQWSRAIYEAYPDVEGLMYATKMHGRAVSWAFYERCEDALGAHPRFNRLLADPSALAITASAAADLDYRIL